MLMNGGIVHVLVWVCTSDMFEEDRISRVWISDVKVKDVVR